MLEIERRSLTQSHSKKSAPLAKSWFHTRPLMAITSQRAIGSPYPSSRSCAMKAFGRVPHPLKGSASWMKRVALPHLDSPIRVTSFHSGDRSIMLGESKPFAFLRAHPLVRPLPPSFQTKITGSAMLRPYSRPITMHTKPTDAKPAALRASTSPSS